jgi:hypothetical protein
MVGQLMVQSLMLLIWRKCLLVKAGDDDLLVSNVYSDYDTTYVEYAKTISYVTLLVKSEQHNNSHGHPSSPSKSYDLMEMIHLQMQPYSTNVIWKKTLNKRSMDWKS